MNRMQAQIVAAQSVKYVAETLGLRGVGAVLILKDGEIVWTPTVVVVGDFQRGPNPEKGEGDTGSNYAAVAMSKLAEMVDTGNNSGDTANRSPKKGELGYRGGVTQKEGNTRFFVCFSGGTPDQDVLVSETAMIRLREAYDPSTVPLIVLVTGGPDIC